MVQTATQKAGLREAMAPQAGVQAAKGPRLFWSLLFSNQLPPHGGRVFMWKDACGPRAPRPGRSEQVSSGLCCPLSLHLFILSLSLSKLPLSWHSLLVALLPSGRITTGGTRWNQRVGFQGDTPGWLPSISRYQWLLNNSRGSTRMVGVSQIIKLIKPKGRISSG